MNIDFPHMIATVVLIFVAVLLIHRTSLYKNGSRLKRFAIVGITLFIVLLVLNLIWPYGESPLFVAG